MVSTIVTLGGGGFSMSDDGQTLTPIDEYLLGLTGLERPRVCFVGTASGDSESYRNRFMHAFEGRAEYSALTLFGSPEYTDPELLVEQDLIFVGGGSTANLLAIWRLHDVPQYLARAADNGAVLAGISAGMNCWFEASSTDSFGSPAPLMDGLGWLPGAACPHYLGESDRRSTLLEWVASGRMPETWALDDGAAIVWRGGEIAEVLIERSNAVAAHVTRHGDEAREELLPTQTLLPIEGSCP